MSTPTIRFDEPAHPALRSDDSLAAFTAALRAQPGQWALLGRYSTPGCMRTAAYEIRHGLNPAFRSARYEAQSRSMFGEHRVYVRYVGGEGQ